MGKTRYILLLTLSLLCAASCQRTELDMDIEPQAPSNNIELFLETPKTSSIGGATRSGSVNELTIHRGYIFVFAPDGTYKGFQKVEEASIEKNNTQYPVIATTITGYDSKKDNIIAVFNYCERTFTGEASLGSLSKEEISDRFPLDAAYLAELQTDFEKGDYSKGMPMFANDFDNASRESVHHVYRALSRIELYIQRSDDPNEFASHSHVFTAANVRYAIINDAANGAIGYSARSDIKGVEGGATYSSGSTLNYKHTPIEYNKGQNVVSLESSPTAIYLYEFPYSRKVITGKALTQGVYDPDRLSIMIEFTDDESNLRYYKLQLIDKSVNSYYDIRRNHDYRVAIKCVYSDGYTTADEAYLMPPSNIEYEIYDDQGDTTFSNGQYAISMDEILNYDNLTIYGPETSAISFDNIRRILPDDVTDPLTDAQLAQMTNIVEFEVVSKTGVTVDVVRNDFEINKKLTDDGKSIKLEITGDGECVIKLKITLGNLVMGFDEIKIVKIGSELGEQGGDSSFDAHPCQLKIPAQRLIEGSWNSEDSDFGAYNKADSMVVYMGENATPVGYKTLNGFISTGSAENAYPYFEPKTRSGYFSYRDLSEGADTMEIKRAKIVLNQLAPFYVGHFANLAESGPHYYNALIVEKIEEIKNPDKGKEYGGVMHWSEAKRRYYELDKIYGDYFGVEKYTNFTEGLEISNYMVDNYKEKDQLPLAARYCYMKNDINGNGIIEDNEPIVWYLPAANQMLSLWISKHLIENQDDSKYFGFSLVDASNAWYWTASEVAAGFWWELGQRNFSTNVARFNILEGEMSISGIKGNQVTGGTDNKAHVRCVRSIVYDNTK